MKLPPPRNHLPAGYAGLLNRVKKTLIEGRQRIEQERVRTYWETGRILHTHILKHKDRARYGEEVLARLAKDIDVSETVLHRCLRFAQRYPILARGPKFSWNHYRKLMTVPDREERLLLEKQIGRNGWSAQELAARIKDERPVLSATRQQPLSPKTHQLSPKLNVQRGQLYTYQIVKRPSLNADQTPELRVDLGFGVFHKVDARLLSAFSEGDIVESRPKEDAYKFYKGSRSAKDLYTYAAFIEKVIDGDTLKVRFDLGFNIEIRETLRLRGLDCPEMDTKEGQAAKAFVQSYIKEAQVIIVRSSRSDKYDRYLADVFIPAASDQSLGTSDGIYLNNLLLETGHAVRMAE